MEQYYVRMRGQVSGPYTLGQLHNLRLRGHLGRFHEVSANQVQWMPASAVPGLFSSTGPLPPVESALLPLPPVVTVPTMLPPEPLPEPVADTAPRAFPDSFS